MRKLLLAAMIFGGGSAEAGTVGWWRMEGTVGENAATVENAANPGTLDAVWNSEASSGARISQSHVCGVAAALGRGR